MRPRGPTPSTWRLTRTAKAKPSASTCRRSCRSSKNGAKIFRVMFNEITKNAIQKAFEKPAAVNLHLVDAQQARRILDRLVGYKISPLLWDKVRRGLSAGRVQTVALRLIVDREREIRAFQKREYWTIDVNLAAKKPPQLSAHLAKKNDENVEIPNEAAAQVRSSTRSTARAYVVKSVTNREKRRNPVPPFITSTLQQEAARKLRFSVKRTMMLAQKLYEGVELGADEGPVGLISYMRTDSTRVSNDALDEVRGMIAERYGADYRPASPNVYKSKKDAQDAHEAIRPTSALRTPESVEKFLAEDELKLYRLIWMRFVASQMTPGRVRSDHHRRRGQGQGRRDLSVPRHRQRSEVRRIPQGLRRRQGSEGRGRRRAEAQAPRGHRRARRCASRASSRSSTSPSRRRASPKRRW